jgi:hypothetical protein
MPLLFPLIQLGDGTKQERVGTRWNKGSTRNYDTLYYAFNQMREIQLRTEPSNVMPITDTLLYSYDFGDGWQIDITLIQEFGKDNQHTDDETAATVINTGKPVCIAKDGCNVVDDCGHEARDG